MGIEIPESGGSATGHFVGTWTGQPIAHSQMGAGPSSMMRLKTLLRDQASEDLERVECFSAIGSVARP
jgi:hypothetical protein